MLLRILGIVLLKMSTFSLTLVLKYSFPIKFCDDTSNKTCSARSLVNNVVDIQNVSSILEKLFASDDDNLDAVKSAHQSQSSSCFVT